MISWETIIDGAALSALVAAVFVFLLRRDRRYDIVAAAAISGAVGPLLWNAILHHLEAREFFVDAPVDLVPASWQDAGSGVFTVAVATIVLGFGPARRERGSRLALMALLCGLAAFLVDVYLY